MEETIFDKNGKSLEKSMHLFDAIECGQDELLMDYSKIDYNLRNIESAIQNNLYEH